MANRVLLLTNSPNEVNILKNMLEKSSEGAFEIEWMRQLSSGVERLRGGGIDAIIASLTLPDSDEISTFNQLFAVAPHTPIMTLRTAQDETLAIDTVQHDARGYLLQNYAGSNLVLQVLNNSIQRNVVEEALYTEKARAEIALNSISDAVICTDMAGNIDYLNIAAEKITGWSRDEARGHPIGEVFKIINSVTRERDHNPVELVLQYDEPMGLNANTLLIRRDGGESAIEDSASPIHDWNGHLTGAVVVFHDVSAAQAMTLKMAHLAQHDFLTDLPNRAFLNDRIAQAITLAKRRRTQFAVMFLDLDNFKHINDSLGHALGDKLLQSVSQRLNSCVRSTDTVSRQGGDEFVVLLGEGTQEKDAAVIADKILAVLGQPHAIGNRELHVTTSIGISVYPADGEDAETLFKCADTAMYHAKEKGRNNYQFFKSEMNTRAVERQLIETNLRRALEKNEFVLYYQATVKLDTGAITGAEALIRWEHPEWGIVLPDRFVPIAEDSGLIVPIGQWVLREACAQAKRWLDDGLVLESIAVNISAVEFRQNSFFERVRATLIETGLAPSCLQLEITESVLMRDAVSSASILQNLKDIGVQLAVDDFGTGYSSLSYLKQFPIDVLKIDQSFVHDIESAHDDGIIVSAVIGMGNSLSLRVVAEGVENKTQLAFLKDHHCEDGQGYLFSHPLIAEQFSVLLEPAFSQQKAI